MVVPSRAIAPDRSTLSRTKENGSFPRANESVMCSTVPKVVQHPTAGLGHTLAHYAGGTRTPHSSAANDPRKIVTPFIASNWEAELRNLSLLDEFADIPPGLREGFRIGVTSSVQSVYTPPNHKSATDNPSVITAHIEKEVAAGRYSGPFSFSTLESLIGPFRSAPLGIVAKPSSPGEFRVIQDFSFPHNSHIPSLNSQINPEDFPCEWGFFSEVVQIIASLPPDAQAATMDLLAAYRCMPIHVDDQPHLVVTWNGQAWVDHCAPFGATSSNGIFGRCGDAKRRILEICFDTKVVKWVDDFLIFRSPVAPTSPLPCTQPRLHFSFDIPDILAVAAPLGWVWKESKTRPFASVFDYLGFEWNIPERTVCIPPKKRSKYAAKLSVWLGSTSVSLKETQNVLGTLIHCAPVVPLGRSHIAGLSRFTSNFPTHYNDRFRRRAPSNWARADVVWWLDQLTNKACKSSIASRPDALDLNIFVDASTSFGIGLVLEDSWSYWKLTPGWKSNGRDIGWAEMVAVELGLLSVIDRGIRNASIRIRSDNQGVIHALDRGRSRNYEQNLVLQRIETNAMMASIHIFLEYVASAANPADLPSRGIPSPLRTYTERRSLLPLPLQTLFI